MNLILAVAGFWLVALAIELAFHPLVWLMPPLLLGPLLLGYVGSQLLSKPRLQHALCEFRAIGEGIGRAICLVLSPLKRAKLRRHRYLKLVVSR